MTALLYLTTQDEETGTLVQDLQGVERRVLAEPGDLLLMQGKRVRHRVPPVPAGTVRVSVPLNLYVEGDCERPDGIDDLVYGP